MTLCDHKTDTILSQCPECARLELKQTLAGDNHQARELWALRLQDHRGELEARDDTIREKS